MSCGAEALVRGIRATLYVDPSMMVLGLDISNAFNTVERSVIMEELRDHFPSLIPFSSWPMAAQDGCCSKPESRGRRCAIRRIKRQHPDLLFPSYADDTHIIGPPAEVMAAYPLLVREVDLMGLRVSPSKSVAWSPHGLPANLQLPHGCQTPANGLAILKVPFGTPAHVAVNLRERLQKHLALLPSLPLLGDTQLALAILTRCIGQRACYLQRTVAPLGMVVELYKEYDYSLQQSLASLLHSSSFPSASASLQASLPTRMGGLGCRSLEQTAQAAFLGCWHLIASLLPMRFPCLHDPVRNVEEGSFPFQADLRSIRDSAISSFPSLQPLLTPFSALAQASDRGAQSRLVTAVEDEHCRRLRRLPEIQNNIRSLARLTSLATPGATDWISSPPVANAFSISSEAFQTSLQLFLGLPPNCLIGVRQGECDFRAEGAVLATHMLRCPTGPEVVGIHNLLRDALAGLMRDAGHRAVVEVNNIMPITTGAQGRHHCRTLDIVGVQPGGGPRALVDVVVTEAYKGPASTHITGHAVGGVEQ
eukprot:SM000006S19526  [mRNA]  locus=s6:1315503:1317175:- [translate_table: standard]